MSHWILYKGLNFIMFFRDLEQVCIPITPMCICIRLFVFVYVCMLNKILIISSTVSKAFCTHGSDFLSCRSQHVTLNRVLSSPLPDQAGVKGSIQGPVLFLVFINDLSYSGKSSRSLQYQLSSLRQASRSFFAICKY